VDDAIVEIRELERTLLTLEVRSSPEKLDRLLSDDFVEFGSSGTTYTKAQIIAAFPKMVAPSEYMLDFRVAHVAPGVVLATYVAGGALRSSLWRREGAQWRLFFHQGTRKTPQKPARRSASVTINVCGSNGDGSNPSRR
jgi:hypothetical protein